MPLRLFPSHGLDNSLLTAVLVGLYVRFFFTEAFGWVFSGLVVPGYLAAVVLLRPLSAAVILVEAALTYLLVRGAARVFSATGLGTPMFGRDRFVWLVVGSVVIRVSVEGVALPIVDQALRARGLDLTGGLGFYGIGLVLVPLAANACWKPGLARGGFQIFVTTALTCALLRLLLVTTNLSLANIALSFERVAVDFAASPKAYLLIVAGALLASRANLRFGWDTSGVLIPGLLCLGWFSPVRLVSTFIEAVLVAGAAYALLQLPRVRDWNVEGPRRVVLVFTVGYAVKFIFVSLVRIPGYSATELFGIGYLLPSLLAVKVWQKRNPALVLLPAVQLSFAALVVGSSVALALARVAPSDRASAVAQAAPPPSCDGASTVEYELRTAAARMARLPPTAQAPRVDTSELGRLEALVRELARARRTTPLACRSLPPRAAALAGSLGLRVVDASSPDGRRFLALREATDAPARLRGFGVVLMAADGGGPTWLVEHPRRDLDDAGVLLGLLALRPAGAIVIGGIARDGIDRGDVTRDRDVPARAAAEALGDIVTLRVGRRSSAGRLVPAALFDALHARLPALSRGGLTSWNAVVELTHADAHTLGGAPATRTHDSSVAEWLGAAPETTQRSLDPIEQLVLAEDVLRPLVSAGARREANAPAAVVGAAAACGYRVATVDVDGKPALGLTGGAGHGALLLASGAAADAPVIEVAGSAPGSVELGRALLRELDGRALIVDGGPTSAPFADVVRAALLVGSSSPAVVLHAGLAPGSWLVSDTVGAAVVDSSFTRRITETLARLGLPPRAVDRFSTATSGAAERAMPLLRLRAAPFVVLQLGPDALARLRARALSAGDRQLFARSGVTTEAAPLVDILRSACAAARPPRLAAGLADALHGFAVDHHPAWLARAEERARAAGVALSLRTDEDGGDPVVVARRSGSAWLVALHPAARGEVTVGCGELSAALPRALAARALVVGVEPRP